MEKSVPSDCKENTATPQSGSAICASSNWNETKSIQTKLLESDPATPEHKKAWDAYYASLEEQVKANAERVPECESWGQLRS